MADEATVLESKDMTATADAPIEDKKLNRTIGGKDYVLPFKANVAKTLDHVIAISSVVAKAQSTEKEPVSEEDVVVKFWNGAYDLFLRSKLAPQLEAQVEGPGRQIDKAAKNLAVALGISESDAREIVVKERTSRGLPV